MAYESIKNQFHKALKEICEAKKRNPDNTKDVIINGFRYLELPEADRRPGQLMRWHIHVPPKIQEFSWREHPEHLIKSQAEIIDFIYLETPKGPGYYILGYNLLFLPGYIPEEVGICLDAMPEACERAFNSHNKALVEEFKSMERRIKELERHNSELETELAYARGEDLGQDCY